MGKPLIGGESFSCSTCESTKGLVTPQLVGGFNPNSGLTFFITVKLFEIIIEKGRAFQKSKLLPFFIYGD
jgi:hypothetical protein